MSTWWWWLLENVKTFSQLFNAAHSACTVGFVTMKDLSSPWFQKCIAGNGIRAVKLESDCSKAWTSACLHSHRQDGLWQSGNAVVWLTPKSCANEMKPEESPWTRLRLLDHLQGCTKTTGNWDWNECQSWGGKNNQHGCSGGDWK